ncbi:hypothetical protein H0A66_03765 [Alcaligenaceae bacterium]|nr:hypothetical protein [Alcaligenaceae bacterium]
MIRPSALMTPGLTLTYSSLWDGLNPNLIASFFLVDRDGRMVDGSPIVKAPLTECEMEVTLNWQSPFENTGPESKAPVLAAMLQSGSLQPTVDALFDPSKAEESSRAMRETNSLLKKFEGRTGITKLNSTQIFTGMQPIKFSAQALFRAWRDAQSEVGTPVDMLMEWALPQELASDGSVLARLVGAGKGETGAIEALLPSLTPCLIGMTYKGRTYAPLVIESIGLPLSSPIDVDGNFVELLVPMILCSLTALDRKDWAETSTRRL